MTSTRRSRRAPTTLPASATATELMLAGFLPIEVSLRARRPVRTARRKTRFNTGPTVRLDRASVERLGHLAENLGFAENHRIETRGDTAQVADRLVPAVPVGMARDVPRIQPGGSGQDLDERRGLHVLADERVELDAVARGEPCELAIASPSPFDADWRVIHPFAQHGQIAPELFAVLRRVQSGS